MKVSISFKHVKHSSEVDERLYAKSSKLEKYLGGKTNIKWHCHYKDGVHYSEVYVSGPKFSYHAKGHHDNLYKAFDVTFDKIERQISKKKEKVKARRQHEHQPHVILDPEQAWSEYEEEYEYENAS